MADVQSISQSKFTPPADPAPTAAERTSTRQTVTALLDAAVATDPHKTYLVTEQDSFTYSQTARHSGSIAAALRAAGVRRGDRVVTVLPNRAETIFIILACARIGAMFTPANPACAPPELAGLVRQAQPSLVVLNTVTPALGEAVNDARVGAAVVALDDLIGDERSAPPAEGAPEDGFLLIGTSGSTSAPKLVEQRQSSVVLGAEAYPAWIGANSSDRFFTVMPLFHSNAVIYSTLGALAAGATLVLMPRFSASRFWGQIREHEATQFNLMGNMGEILLSRPAQPDDADNPVRIAYSAWAPAEETHRTFERRFGLDMIVGYGLSESIFGTVWPLGGNKPFGTIGRPRQHPTMGVINQARVINEAGEDVAPGRTGQLLLRNPTIMRGYFGQPDVSATVMDDGWLHTGDLVHTDPVGNYVFDGRQKDLIRRSGENFAPIEVEEALDAHEAVRVSAVVPVPSVMAEDDAKAFVVLEDSASVTAEDLIDWLRTRIARFKLPRYIEFIVELPMTSTGRVAKGQLPRSRTDTEHDVEAVRNSPRPS